MGFPRRDFLYHMPLWEIRAAVRGYQRRRRDMWAATRWQTFWLLHNGTNDLRRAGIHRPADLIRFPWETDDHTRDEQPDDEEVRRLRQLIREENEHLSQARPGRATR